MTGTRTRYYVQHSGIDGRVIQLSRIVWSPDGSMEGARWDDGEWIEDDGVIREVMDLVVEDISEEGAMAIMQGHS